MAMLVYQRVIVVTDPCYTLLYLAMPCYTLLYLAIPCYTLMRRLVLRICLMWPPIPMTGKIHPVVTTGRYKRRLLCDQRFCIGCAIPKSVFSGKNQKGLWEMDGNRTFAVPFPWSPFFVGHQRPMKEDLLTTLATTWGFNLGSDSLDGLSGSIWAARAACRGNWVLKHYLKVSRNRGYP